MAARFGVTPSKFPTGVHTCPRIRTSTSSSSTWAPAAPRPAWSTGRATWRHAPHRPARSSSCPEAERSTIRRNGGPPSRSASRRCCTNSGVSTKNIIAVAVTTMWGVTVAVDERGEPLMNAMSWMDVRGAKYNHELVKGFPMVEGFQLGLLLKYLDKHGFPPSPDRPPRSHAVDQEREPGDLQAHLQVPRADGLHQHEAHRPLHGHAEHGAAHADLSTTAGSTGPSTTRGWSRRAPSIRPSSPSCCPSTASSGRSRTRRRRNWGSSRAPPSCAA